MNKTTMRKIIPLVILLFLLSGCRTGGLFKKTSETLGKTASTYYKMLMWKYYDRAAQFVDREKAYEFEEFVLAAEDTLNITSYEIRDLVLIKEKNKGVITVLINYYKYPSVSEESVIIEDRWVERDGNWYVSPEFGEGIYR